MNHHYYFVYVEEFKYGVLTTSYDLETRISDKEIENLQFIPTIKRAIRERYGIPGDDDNHTLIIKSVTKLL